MNIDAGREESGVNESGKFLRSGFGSRRVVRHIEENMLLLFRDVIVVDFVANIRGADENTRVILLEGGMTTNGECRRGINCFHGSFPERGTAEFAENGWSIVAGALHDISIALMTEFICGDEISIKVTWPFAFATRYAAHIALSESFSGSGSMWDGIQFTGWRGSDERKRSGFADALKWEKIPSEVTNRALRSGKSGGGGSKSRVRH